MSMRKTDESRKRLADAPRVSSVHVHPPPEDEGEMPSGRMDAPAAGLAADDGGMPRGEMAGGDQAGGMGAGQGEMPRGAMDGGEAGAVAGGDGAAGAGEMPRGAMNGPGPDGATATGEMPPARGALADAAAVSGTPFNLEVGGEWRLILTSSFARPHSG